MCGVRVGGGAGGPASTSRSRNWSAMGCAVLGSWFGSREGIGAVGRRTWPLCISGGLYGYWILWKDECRVSRCG